MLFYKKIDDEIDILGTKYKVKAYFNVILKLFDLLDDVILNDEQKINTGLKMLLGDDLKDKHSLEERAYIFTELVSRFAEVEEQAEYDILGNPMPKVKEEEVFDYQEDSDYIYAAFMQVYGIDLIEEQNKLSWYKFKALLDGLTGETKLSQVISIRAWNEFEEEKSHKENMRQLKSKFKLKGGD